MNIAKMGISLSQPPWPSYPVETSGLGRRSAGWEGDDASSMDLMAKLPRFGWFLCVNDLVEQTNAIQLVSVQIPKGQGLACDSGFGSLVTPEVSLVSPGGSLVSFGLFASLCRWSACVSRCFSCFVWWLASVFWPSVCCSRYSVCSSFLRFLLLVLLLDTVWQVQHNVEKHGRCSVWSARAVPRVFLGCVVRSALVVFGIFCI